jgi:hypothetical protein
MVSKQYSAAKTVIGRPEREILVQVNGYHDFPKPSVHGFPEVANPAIVAAGTLLNPLPCQAWHGCEVTSAHRVEIEVGADGHPSEPPSGAAAPLQPAGAEGEILTIVYVCRFGTFWYVSVFICMHILGRKIFTCTGMHIKYQYVYVFL